MHYNVLIASYDFSHHNYTSHLAGVFEEAAENAIRSASINNKASANFKYASGRP